MVADACRGTHHRARVLAGGVIRTALARAGYDIVRREVVRRVGGPGPPLPPDFDDEAASLCARVAPYTLTSPERILALRDSVRYVEAAGVPGAIVECGVWRGGSMQVVALTLRDVGVDDRDVHMFDTFRSMPRPDERDVDLWGRPASRHWEGVAEGQEVPSDGIHDYLPLDEVKAALFATGYPPERFHFVEGLVEQTVPAAAPEVIALLRLDTDWYASTRHELEHLFPRVAPGGVVIIDDYGHFRGARQAVDEYLAEQRLAVYLHRIDYSGRLILVPRTGPPAARG